MTEDLPDMNMEPPAEVDLDEFRRKARVTDYIQSVNIVYGEGRDAILFRCIVDLWGVADAYVEDRGIIGGYIKKVFLTIDKVEHDFTEMLTVEVRTELMRKLLEDWEQDDGVIEPKVKAKLDELELLERDIQGRF